MKNILTRKWRTYTDMSWPKRRARINIYFSNLRRGVSVFFATIIYLPLAIPFRLMGYRFLPLHVTRHFGNIVSLPAIYIRGAETGYLSQRIHPVIIAKQSRVINQSILNYWSRYFWVIDGTLWPILLAPLTVSILTRIELTFVTMTAKRAAGDPLIGGPVIDAFAVDYESLHGSSQVLTLDDDHVQRGRAATMRLGMPEDAWFAAIHVREQNSLGETVANHRNADIRTYYDAIRLITDRGGWVVRVGDPSMTRLDEMEHVIDYVHSAEYSKDMDIFLLAECRFMLATTSGPHVSPGVFGKPVAVANFIPYGHGPMFSNDLFIYKLLWSDKENRYLTFKELLQNPELRNAFRESSLIESCVVAVDNSAEEIRDLTSEMLDRLDGLWTPSAQQIELQKTLQALREAYKDNYSYGLDSQMGSEFIQANSNLLV